MSIFATEFPVSADVQKAVFLSQAIAWLRGSDASRVLDEADSQDLDKTFAHLKSANGEELIFRELIKDGLTLAIGFRHDLPDQNGRLWRTESVLKPIQHGERSGFITFKTQCMAVDPNAKTDTPKKPYLIKSVINDRWTTDDGLIAISDKPLWLTEGAECLNLAASITNHDANTHLPIIYISAKSTSRWKLSPNAIDKLAYELGGVAHVIVEPSRQFSFSLRDLTQGKNIYGGNIAFFVPNYGILKNLSFGDGLIDEQSLSYELRNIAINARSQMPILGWDWLKLQEESLHDQRIRDRNRLSTDEIEKIYQEEINTKSERINELEAQLANRPISTPEVDNTGKSMIAEFATQQAGEVIYPNELSDRVRLAISYCLKHAENDGLDKRSISVLEKIFENTKYSSDVAELKSDLRRASRDSKRITGEITSLLSRHGYVEKSDNKHIRLEPRQNFFGLDNITLSKTPGDHRSLDNMRKQVEKTLGITRFGDED